VVIGVNESIVNPFHSHFSMCSNRKTNSEGLSALLSKPHTLTVTSLTCFK